MVERGRPAHAGNHPIQNIQSLDLVLLRISAFVAADTSTFRGHLISEIPGLLRDLPQNRVENLFAAGRQAFLLLWPCHIIMLCKQIVTSVLLGCGNISRQVSGMRMRIGAHRAEVAEACSGSKGLHSMGFGL